jgi:hypothetical protein
VRLSCSNGDRQRCATRSGVARVLAEGLAACDFPPNGDGASAHHVSAALRAHGLDPDDL